MNLSKFAKKLTVFGVSAVMMLGNISPVSYQVKAEEPTDASSSDVTWEKVEDSSLKILEPTRVVEEDLEEAGLIKDGNVRVSIVVEGDSTIDAGYSAQSVTTNSVAQSYREQVLKNQKALEAKISAEALGGQPLDVVWNITLAGNIISANVPYAKIEMIKKVAGVKDVVIENQYEAPETVKGDDPNMMISTDMTGTSLISSDYTGAGQAVAVIDTGADIDHQSFNPEAFEYSIENLGKEVDLITLDDVKAVFSQLNASTRMQGVTAEDVYRSAKVPFAYNYVDNNLNVIHINDTQGEHGSHVSGIATANKYIKTGEGTFELAADYVKMQGQAPDAQLLVMKVFGARGGAYDSDYFAAIEDAMVLGAASANLSLGSGNPGLSYSPTYASILNKFTENDTVVTMSAGNAYAWATSAAPIGYLYSDDASFATGGSPGSFTNSFTVASVENDGVIGMPIKVGGSNVFYNDGSSASNEPFVTLAGEHGYIAIDGVGTAEEMAALNDVLEGKIAVVSRGTTSFFEKANAAVENGAIGTLIYNNQPGTISMSLSGYLYTAPAASVTQAEGALIKAAGEKKATEEGAEYYEGTLEVTGDYTVSNYNSDYYLMSDFSSWGTTGDLNLKPEITAPGGNIFSVYGTNKGQTGDILGGIDQYELMSGTSMAAPQISGIDAVFQQYIEENDLVAKTGLTKRQLTLSLLMSTAKPLIEEDSGNYYSILKVGAGLADVAAAASAKSYISMDGTTVNGQAVEKAAYNTNYADKKVKAMLGEDAERTGKYTVTFDVTNFSDEDVAFTFDADMFTQDIFEYDGDEYLDEWTVPIDAVVNFSVDGEPVEAEGAAADLDFNGDQKFDAYDAVALLDYVVGTRDEITDEDKADLDEDGDIDTYDAYLALDLYREAKAFAEAGETITVTADIDLNGSLDELGNEDRNGAYVEGYLYVTEADSEEGVAGVEHSIPVLGYYGSWSEAEMTDKGSVLEYTYEEETRVPYMYAANGNNAYNSEYFGIRYAGDSRTYVFGGNPFIDDETYHPERNAINSADTLYNAAFSLIRNSVGGLFTVKDADGKELTKTQVAGQQNSAYYYWNGSTWQGTTSSATLNYKPAAEEGTALTIEYKMTPEYYQENGKIDWDAMDPKPSMSVTATVDNTAPELVGDEPIKVTEDEEGNVTALEVTIKDNQYIAAVALATEDDETIDMFYAEEEAEAGETKTYTFDLSESDEPHLYIAAYDYAANETIYKINLNSEELDNDLTVNIVEDEVVILKGTQGKATVEVGPWGADSAVTWSVEDETVATVDENGLITGIEDGQTTITAAAADKPEVKDTATLVVKSFDIDLNAVIWDEEGAIWYSEFNTSSLPNYTKIAGADAEIASLAYDHNGTLYAASYDSSEDLSTLYVINEEDFTATEVGPSDISYADLCKAPSLGDNIMLGIYGPYIVLVDTTTGGYLGALNMSRYTRNANIIGIAYEEQYANPNYGNVDYVLFVDQNGTLYEVGILPYNGSYANFGASTIGKIADATDVEYFQSLYYDGTNIFFSRFSMNANKVDLVMVDGFNGGSGQVWTLGSFADGVWPVGGLYEEGVYDIGMPETGDAAKDAAVIDGYVSTESIARIERSNIAVKGGLNVAADTDANRPVADKNGGGTSDKTIIEVTTDTDATNGLYTVSYDPAAVELVSAEGATKYNAINDAEEGEVKVGFINGEALAEGTVVAELTFRNLDATTAADIGIVTEEENDQKSGASEDVVIDGSGIAVTGEVINANITGDDWGPGIDRITVKLDAPVDGAYITKDLFDVTQAVNNGNPQARTILDAYVSDAEGTKVDGESDYITFDLRITPLEGNPIVWSMQTWTNSWANPLVIDVDLKDGAKLFAGEDEVTALEIEGNIDVASMDSEDVTVPQLEGYEFGFYQAADGLNIPYGFYTPENADDGNEHALVIWNHGVGERGMDARIALLGNEVTALSGEEFQALFDGAYVFVPQQPTQGRGNMTNGVIEMIEKYIADENLNVDPDRIIVGGCSMGGGQTMSQIFARPDLFAAAYPICPATSASGTSDAQINAIANLPIWFTHCVNDGTVRFNNSSPALVEKLQAAGNENVHWSYYDDVHDTTGRFNDLTEDGSDYVYDTHWSWVYFDNNYNVCDDEDCDNLNEWEWLAAQNRADQYEPGVVIEDNTDYEDTDAHFQATFTYEAPEGTQAVALIGNFHFYTADEVDAYVAEEEFKTYTPYEYKDGMYNTGYDVAAYGYMEFPMENVAGNIWQIEMPLPGNQYFYDFVVTDAEGNKTTVKDPTNMPFANNGADSGHSLIYVGSAEDCIEGQEYVYPREDGQEGTVEYIDYTDVEGNTRTIGVYVPYGYDEAETYKTLYLAHGGGGNEVEWFNIGSAKNIFDNLIAEGEVDPTIVVTMNNTVYNFERGASVQNIVEVIKPLIEEKYSVSTDAADRAIAGLSSGASVTAQAALEAVEEFDYYGIFSPSRTLNFIKDADGNNTVTDAQRVGFRRAENFYVSVGEFDSFVRRNVNVDAYDELKSAGASTEFFWKPGAHDWAVWRNQLTEFAKDYLWEEGEKFLFDDVKDENKYFFDPVYWAFYSNPQITKGTSDTTFSPNESVTRGQFVTFLYRAAGEPDVDVSAIEFTDVKADKFYAKAVAWAVENKITTGTSATTFAPNEAVTRAQIVTFLYRYASEPDVEIDIPFTDVKAGSFYEKAVAWAVQNKITTGTSATKFSPNEDCTRGQAVTFLYRVAAE